MVENVDFHCDIVGKLPLEICLNILQYLELYLIFQAQRVSRRWAEILTSGPALGYLLRTWYQEDEIVTSTLELSLASDMAEHIDAHHRGSPFSRMLLALSEVDGMTYKHFYADGIVAWLNDSESGSVEYRYLADGERCILRTPNREQLEDIAISSLAIVALASSSGKTYIWSLPITPQSHPKIVQLKSATDARIAVAGQTVVTFQYWNSKLVTGATVFRMDTGTTSYFEMPHWNTYGSRVCLDYDGQSILFFERDLGIRDSGKEEHFCFVQYNLQVGRFFGFSNPPAIPFTGSYDILFTF